MTWVELRVHGVSGTPPEEMLDKPHVVQVDGDDKSRFFRAIGGDDRELLGPADGHTVEGFHWGRYTSGTWTKSMYLALIPFGLVNAATFMLPAVENPRDGYRVDEPARRWRTAAMAGLRLQAIFLTITFAFATGLVSMDIVGTRWAYRNLDTVPDGLERLVPAGGAVVAAMVFVALGRRLRVRALWDGPPARPEPDAALQPVDAVEPRDPIAVDAGKRRTPFALRDFYGGDSDTPTLRALHVAAGLFTVALMAQRMSGREDWSDDPVGIVVCVLLLLTILVTFTLGDPERAAPTLGQNDHHTSRMLGWHRIVARVALVLLVAAAVAVVTAAVALYAVEDPFRKIDGGIAFVGRVNEFDQLGTWLVALGGTAALLAAVPTLLLARRARTWQPGPDDPAWHYRPYSGGTASIAFANLAVLLGVGFSAAMVTGTSTVLGLRSFRGTRSDIEGSTHLIDRVAYAWGLAIVIVLVLLGAWLLVSRVRSRAVLERHVAIGYPERTFPAERDDASPYPPRRLAAWSSRLATAVWLSRLKNHAAGLAWTIVGTGGVLALFLVWDEMGELPESLAFLSVIPDDVSEGRLPPFWEDVGPVLSQVGSWLLLGLVVLLIAKGRQAVKDERTRRGINIIWDVVAFWPHAVHPFTAEPYSQRAVVDFTERIRHHVAARPDDAEGRHVVVCGHSQGSLVSFAALHLLSDEELRHVALLTFGSQLRVIFPRAFPAYVNHAAIVDLRERLGTAWVNLYRDTDALAGPVLSWNHEEPAQACEHLPVPDLSDPRLDEGHAALDQLGIWRCGDDWRLPDPLRRLPALPPGVPETQVAPINRLRGHSLFWSDPAWNVALTELRLR